VSLSAKAQFDAVMRDSFASQPGPQALGTQQINRTLFEHTCPDALLDVLATARLQDDGINIFEVQQVRKQQAGWPGPDDPNLSRQFHAINSPFRVSSGGSGQFFRYNGRLTKRGF
jgi:hypothetical protein